MIFGPTDIDLANGTVLAHTHRLPGRVLKKGAILDAGAVAALRSAGHHTVIVAALQPGDVGEDAAAARIAAALVSPGLVSPNLSATRAATGRVNLHAVSPGLLQVDAARVDALNALNEAVTVATLPDATPVVVGEMVATIKIIPFAVPNDVLRRAEAACCGGAMAVHAWQARRVGLVLSTLPGLKASVLAGTISATEARIASVGGTMLPPAQCPHRTEPIAAALTALLSQGADLLLVAGASAVVDRRDVGPAAIVAAGGDILHFGMPVDPGNLICLGRIGAVPALVLPGCARSPKPNGIDLVLQRLAAGLPLTGATITGMGVGGLLKDVALRPLPRARATTDQSSGVSLQSSERPLPRARATTDQSSGVSLQSSERPLPRARATTDQSSGVSLQSSERPLPRAHATTDQSSGVSLQSSERPLPRARATTDQSSGVSLQSSERPLPRARATTDQSSGVSLQSSERPLPRARATTGRAAPQPAAVGAIVLAAGQSSRMAPRHKLLESGSSGRPIIARVVDAVLGSRASSVIVVTGHREEDVRAALRERPITLVTAPDYADGLSASLRAGLAALPHAVTAALVVLGDMPLVTSTTLDRLIQAYDAEEGRLIVTPIHQGEIGNPVLWDRRFFTDMMSLQGDRGARALLQQHAEWVAEVETDETILRDFDTAESLLTLPP